MPASAPEDNRLAHDMLRPRIAPDALRGAKPLEDAGGLPGQDVALEAIAFGADIRQSRFNLFVMGPEGSGRHGSVLRLLGERAARMPPSDDWVYVHNFDTPWKPIAIRLPPGKARAFRDASHAMMEELRSSIPALFETDAYRESREDIDEEAEEEQNTRFHALREKASAQRIAIVRTPIGFTLAPVKDGDVMKPDALAALTEAERKAIEETIRALQEELEDLLQEMPAIERHRRDRIRELNAQMASTAIDTAIGAIRSRFAGIDAISTRLDRVREDLLKRVEIFVTSPDDAEESLFPEVTVPIESDPRFRRYLVNAFITNGRGDAAAHPPIIHEDHPTLADLVGRIEHVARLGALETDFLMIRPGALHRANGGFLILDALQLLREPWAWDALKRALRSSRIAISSAAQEMSLMSTISLDPEPIPLDVKVVLIGERLVYHLLGQFDPEFDELFKITADFEDELPLDTATLPAYAGLVEALASRNGLRPLAPEAIAGVIVEAARMAGDAERLSLRIGLLADLLCEADHVASCAGRGAIGEADVERAIGQRERRAGRLKRKALEHVTRGIRLIDTTGARVGQVNGLSVIQVGPSSFGQPSRITARVRVGSGKLIDIERETKLGGPLHSKGVLILSSYLAATYAPGMPMSLWASLVFEQSYGGVDGDSASAAELFALLSALSGVPIRQDLAVTGSVNQLGEVQAIGGVNEKIEGFFDLCAERGLTGEQGVLIPRANVAHLVLRPRVVEAVREGRFAVFAISTIDEGIELLTGTSAGSRGTDGRFPDRSVNRLAEDRLLAFAEARRRFGARRMEDTEHDRTRADD